MDNKRKLLLKDKRMRGEKTLVIT